MFGLRRLTLLFSLLPCLPAWSSQTLHVVTEAWAPYVFERNGESVGSDYELARVVLAEMGYTLDLQYCPWKRCLLDVEQGRADAILDVQTGPDGDRKRFLHFPPEPLSESPSVLFFDRRRPFRYGGLESLRDKRVSVALGYVYDPKFDSSPLFKREPSTSHEQNLRKLVADRVDVALINRDVGLYTATQLGLANQVGFDPTPIATGVFYLGFAKKPGLDKLAQDFGQRLRHYKRQPAYRELRARYGLK